MRVRVSLAIFFVTTESSRVIFYAADSFVSPLRKGKRIAGDQRRARYTRRSSTRHPGERARVRERVREGERERPRDIIGNYDNIVRNVTGNRSDFFQPEAHRAIQRAIRCGFRAGVYSRFANLFCRDTKRRTIAHDRARERERERERERGREYKWTSSRIPRSVGYKRSFS